MKTTAMLICLLVLIACEGNREAPPEPESSTKAPPLPGEELEIKSDSISLKEAAAYISRFINEQHLPAKFEGIIGGTFEANTFFSDTSVDRGVMMWYCFNETTTGYPKVFMSIETMNHCLATKPDVQPQSVTLLPPVNYFKYPADRATSQAAVLQFLDRRIESTIPSSDIPVTRQGVISFGTEFHRRHISPDGDRYNKANYAYFQNNPVDSTTKDGILTQLLNQPDVTHVRYYFGLDPCSTDNKIRIILVGVTSAGRLAKSIIVQKSIPTKNRC